MTEGGKFQLKRGTKVAEFCLSNGFFDIIQGPLGCLSADTEFLTSRGWQAIANYKAGDDVGEWDPATGMVAFRKPRSFIDLPCEEMWRFSNEHSLSMVLSDEHRCPVYDWRGRFMVKTASQLAARPSWHTVPVVFALDRPGLGLTDDEIRLAVAIKADGCLPKRGNQCVVGIRKDRKKLRMRELLNANGVAYEEFYHEARPTEANFTFARTDLTTKGYEPSWWHASHHQLEVILAECLLWDGLAEHDEQRFFTTEKDAADFIQFAAHATGRRATIHRREYDEKLGWRPGYTVAITVPGSRKNAVQLRVDGTKIERVPAPRGRKYCFETQTGFFVARHRDRIFITGNSGKTQAMVARIMRHIQTQRVSRITNRRMSRWGVVRNTYPELKNTTIKTWLEPTLVPEEIYGRMNWSPPPTHRLRFGDVDAEVIFLALDKPDDYNKLRSFEFTGIAWNELSFLPKSLVDEATGRLRYPGPGHGGSAWHGMIADTNAPDEDHWLAIMTGQVPMPPDLTEDEQREYEWPDDWKFFMQPPAVLEVRDARGQVTGYSTNPAAENLENLRSNYYTQALKSKSKPWIDSRLRNVVALVVDGSPVWPQFSVDSHVASAPLRPVPTWPVVVGIDFGRQPAATFMQMIGERCFVQYELLGFNEGAVTFAPKLKRFLETHYAGMQAELYGDPKGRDKGQTDDRTPYDIFAAHGLKVTPAGDVDPRKMIGLRVDAVTSLLTRMYDGRPCFVLSPLCRTLKLAMAGRYHLTREEDGELKPNKDKYSHVADALQYGVLGLGAGNRLIGITAAGEIKPMKVYTRKSLRRVS